MINNTTGVNVPKGEAEQFNVAKLAEVIEKLRDKVGDVRDDLRHQLAHRIGVSANELRKFQTPGHLPSASLLHTLIAHYYPDKILAPTGGLAKYSRRLVEYWTKLHANGDSDDDASVTYL